MTERTAGEERRLQGRKELALLAIFALVTLLLAVLSVGVLYTAGQEGLFLGLLLALVIGLAILLVAGLETWLPMLFVLGLLAALNLTIERIPLTLYGFDVLLLGLYAGWLWRAYRGEARGVRWRAVDTAAAGFLAWLLLTSLLAHEVPVALDGWLLYVRGFLIYFYFAHGLQQRWQVHSVVAALMLMLALQGGLGLLQYVTRSNIGSISDLVGGTVSTVREVETVSGAGLFRVRGTLNTDTSLSHWLEMLVPLAVSLFLAARQLRHRLVLGGALLAGIAVQVVTFTRGGWFGLAAGVAVAFALHFRGRLLNRRNLLLAAGLLVLLALLMVPFAGLIRARLFESEQDTLAVRENLNRAALDIIADHPLTGIGLDNFVYVAPDYGTGWTWLAEGKSHKVHNVYLAVATEAGPLGLLLFLGVLGLALAHAWSAAKLRPGAGIWRDAPLARGIVAGLGAVLVHGLAAWGVLSYGVFPVFWLLLGLAVQDTPGEL